MQGTPLSKATCVATHSRMNKGKKKGGGEQVAPGKQSILVLVIFFVQLPLLFGTDTLQGVFFII